MLTVRYSSRFKKDLKLCAKRGADMSLLEAVIEILRIPAPLPPSNRNHALAGNWTDYQECHIQADWLLIYRVDGDELLIYRTGTLSDLFGK